MYLAQISGVSERIGKWGLSTPHQFLAGTLNYSIKSRLRLPHLSPPRFSEVPSSLNVLSVYFWIHPIQRSYLEIVMRYRTMFDWRHRRSRLLFQLEFRSELLGNSIKNSNVICFSENLSWNRAYWFTNFSIFFNFFGWRFCRILKTSDFSDWKILIRIEF